MSDPLFPPDVMQTVFFEQIANKKDWKKPINAVIVAASKALVEEAIIHFTATIPTFEPVKNRPSYLRVRSEGYRMGPAGDH